MRRENENVYFTTEDKNNLVIKSYTDAEISENRKKFNKKRNKTRLALLILLIFFISISVASEKIRYVAEVVIVAFSLGLILIEWVNRINYQIAKSKYYFEIIVLKKNEIESYLDYSVTAGSSMICYYPIVGRDSTSGYECVCYVDKDKYENAICGQNMRINVRGPQL